VQDAGIRLKKIASENNPKKNQMIKELDLWEITQKMMECEKEGEYKQGAELVYKAKTGVVQRARFMYTIPNPSKIIVETSTKDSSTTETEFDFECELIDAEQYYMLLPEDLRKKIENVAKFEKFKHKNKGLDCIRLNLKRKIA
jgi:hypothetical protein